MGQASGLSKSRRNDKLDACPTDILVTVNGGYLLTAHEDNMLNTFDVAMCAAEEAATILSRFFDEGFNIRLKGVSDMVTDADVASERRIAAVIREAFPNHSILGEEENSAT